MAEPREAPSTTSKQVPDTIPSYNASESDVYIDPQKEAKIIRKFDWLVLPQFVVIIILAYLDRTNIGRRNLSPFDVAISDLC